MLLKESVKGIEQEFLSGVFILFNNPWHILSIVLQKIQIFKETRDLILLKKLSIFLRCCCCCHCWQIADIYLLLTHL